MRFLMYVLRKLVPWLARRHEDNPPERKDPEDAIDPAWGMGLFIVGMLLMAYGGAATRHWVFNVGETLLLIGVGLFLGAVAITSHRHEHIVKRLQRAFNAEEEQAAAEEERDEED